jgi:predicted DNA-binding antitoxin AbrB/MazE fold protein
MAGPTRVRALYEGGVFKPLGAVELPERAEVELTVVDRTAFGAWWQGHSERMRRRTAGIAQAEIDSDVDAAMAEVRAARTQQA